VEPRPYVPVTIPLLGDARLKNWAKVVEHVDESKASGWAYEGAFIATGGVQDVPIGSVILLYGEKGSRGNPQSLAEVLVANSDGTLSRHATASGQAWARTLRDEIADLVGRDDPPEMLQWDPALMRYEDEALRSELRRRGLEGT
jgi:hypothetical protein